MENLRLIYFYASSIILGVILFFPTKKFISSMAINRLQRKEKRAATEEEMVKIRKRVVYVAAIVAMTFAYIFNKFIMFKLYGEIN